MEYDENRTLHDGEYHRWVCTNESCEWVALLMPEWHDYGSDYQLNGVIIVQPAPKQPD